jgi:predicted flap endonuclease-1-like 5' DNA nuclease
MSRSIRTLIAIVVWLLAGFLAINNVVLGSALGDWLVPFLLLVLGLILVLYPETEGEAEAEQGELAPSHAPTLTEHAAAPVAEPVPAPAPTPAPVAAAEPAPKPVPAPPPAAATAPAPEPESTEPDDLSKIEGIGPKLSEALIASGLGTYVKLAAASEDEIRTAIKAQGMRFAPSIPTWAEQANYAARGDWDGLEAFQSTLTAGRRE